MFKKGKYYRLKTGIVEDSRLIGVMDDIIKRASEWMLCKEVEAVDLRAYMDNGICVSTPLYDAFEESDSQFTEIKVSSEAPDLGVREA